MALHGEAVRLFYRIGLGGDRCRTCSRPGRGWRRPGLRPVDLLVFAALLALLFGLLRLAPALNAPC